MRHYELSLEGEGLIKIGAKVVRHARYVTFQMAELAIQRLFATILRRIAPLCLPVGQPVLRDTVGALTVVHVQFLRFSSYMAKMLSRGMSSMKDWQWDNQQGAHV